MSKAEQERLDHLNEFEREMEEKARRFREKNSKGNWIEEWRHLIQALGLPEDEEELRRHFRREELRRRIKLIAVCTLPIALVGLVVLALWFGWR